MKRFFIIMISLLAMLTARLSANAQEITITLNPGWNWISYPRADTLGITEAMGSFIPLEEDVLTSHDHYAEYVDGEWFGDCQLFYPGQGYMYYSNRNTPVTFNFQMQQPVSSVDVTTGEPTDITAVSATISGEVMLLTDTHVFMRGVCWGTTSNPDIDGIYFLDGAGEGLFNVTLDELTPNTTYYVRAYAVSDHGLAYGEEQSFTTLDNGGGGGDDHAYVDLGLPSGLLWATCNIGAENPEDYGDYFAWGETQPKDYYDWDTYQYCNGSNNTLTKYCNNSSYGYNGFTDNLTALLPEDDAATAKWGEGWRMPTKEEFQELYNNTASDWTTQNGVNGWLFTASNGNSLFLPAAGYRDTNDLYHAGSHCYYWSSSLDTLRPSYAFGIDFNSLYYSMYSNGRLSGQSVRPVRSSQNITSYVIDVTSSPAEGGTVEGSGTYEQGTECTLTATANEGYTFTNWTENDEVVSTEAAYTFTVTGDRTLVANFTANGGGGGGDDHAYVDLGLPSGLLWATCNVGADTPEDYGDYFAWGETQPKDTYNYSTYQYCMGSSSTLTKYCNNSSYGYNGFTDNLPTLLPEDDAATANWGNGWRMPTKEEFEELYNNTTVTWTTQNGVNGRLFTASNGNSLFLPAGGFRDSSTLYNAGSDGIYWSSSLYSVDPSSAWCFCFYSVSYSMYSGYRYCGQSVRPVRLGQNITSYVIDVTSSPAEGGTVEGSGTYEQGQTCTLTATANEGYTFVNWTENDEVVSTDATYTFTVTGNRTLVANFTQNGGGNAPTGAINGKFTVNDNGDQVYFSQGNLQYQASTDTWKFAENQYDYVGSTNSNISSSYSGWIDLFGWGTSGWNSGNTYYHPWDSDYSNGSTYGPSGQYNLTGSYANADWGVYNPISNGGNTSNQWRTLTQPEWNYLFNTRTTTSGIRYAKANVNNINGVILLPDNWSSTIFNLSNTNNSGASFSSNTISASQWTTLEDAGAVFLPAAGNRLGTSVYNVGSGGYYWSASYYGSGNACLVNFGGSGLDTDNYINRYYGRSVRLVCPAE